MTVSKIIANSRYRDPGYFSVVHVLHLNLKRGGLHVGNKTRYP